MGADTGLKQPTSAELSSKVLRSLSKVTVSRKGSAPGITVAHTNLAAPAILPFCNGIDQVCVLGGLITR